MPLKQLQYYKNTNDSEIKCLLCGHACILKEGKSGICGVNMNRNGSLFCKAYGKPAALNIDPVEKKPLSHFMEGSVTFSVGTYGCNLNCMWCQNYHISCARNHSFDEDPRVIPSVIVSKALENKCSSISYTYNEPTVFYPYARDIGMIAKENGLKNIFVTNGYQSDLIINDMTEWVDAANVDLKGFNSDKYPEYTGADLEKIKNNLKILIHSKMHVEITTLIIPDYNDSAAELGSIAEFISNELGTNVPWHVSAFHPEHKMRDRKRTSREKIYEAVDIGRSKGLNFVHPGNVW